MTLQLNLIIPNLGPPKFKQPLKDVKIKVGEQKTLKFPAFSDPDWEDDPSLQYINFGNA